MTDAVLGYGAQLRVGATTAATTATVLLGGVTSMPPPPFNRDLVQVTAFDSPDATHEFIPALNDPGEFAFDINWRPGNPTDLILIAMQAETAPRVFEISFTQVSPVRKYTFTGFLTAFEPGATVEEQLSASVTIKVTGKPVVS